MSKDRFILAILFLTVLLFLAAPSIYAETAEEYYARTGNAVVFQPGGGFIKAYVPRQDQGKREELTSGVSVKGVEVSAQAQEYNRQGEVSIKSGNYYQAIQQFTRAIEIQPKFAKAIHNRGLAYSASGNHIQAIDEYRKSIELDPNNPVVYYDRALDYSTLRNYPQVIADCTKAIKMGYYYGAAYALRAYAYNNMRIYDKALADFLEANARGEHISQDLIQEVRNKVKAKKAELKAAKEAQESKEAQEKAEKEKKKAEKADY